MMIDDTVGRPAEYPADPEAAASTRDQIRWMARRRREQLAAVTILFLGGALAVVMVLSIFIFVAKESLPIFTNVDQRNEMSLYHDTENEEEFERDASIFQTLDNLLGQPIWQPVSDQSTFSLWPLMAGTFKITIVAVVEGTVLSFFTAIAIAFYLPRRMRYAVKVITELLAGIPSVVLGFLGLMFFATYFQDLFGYPYRLNAFLAGTVLSLTVIPIMTTLFEDIYSSYSRDQILAAKAVGMYDYQVIGRVIIPATYGKVFAAALLGFGRCFGETMIVLMCSGNAAVLDAHLTSGARSLAATIGAEMAEVIIGWTHYSVLFLLGLLLILFTFVINYLSQILIRKWTYA
ncbi:MAG: ABC transporter permease subunit [Nitrospinae bacterium]|nr:ABC transporter permease subunit [Nitrospinota bacterium]